MNSRLHFIDQLEAYQKNADPAQRLYADRLIDLAKRQSDATLRNCFPAHFTASAIITNGERNLVLLCHHRKLDKWLQLGGHADGSWDLADTALREAQEESGLTDLAWHGTAAPVDLDIHLIPARASEPAHWHYDVRFILIATRPDLIQVSAESLALRWVNAAEAYELAQEPALHRLFDRLWKE